MSEHDVPPLDPDILALLEEAKPIPALGEGTKDALFASITSRIAHVPSGGGDGGASGGSAPRLGAGAIRAAVALVGTFAIGVAVGMRVEHASTPPTVVPSMSAVTPSPSASSVASVEVSGVPVDSLPSARTTTTPRVEPSAPAPVVSARGLAAERSLLDVARSALARGEAKESLTAAERHAREYPDGVLAEERDAIVIKALVALGRRDEARARAAAFERKFPNGLMLRAVKSAVDSAP